MTARLKYTQVHIQVCVVLSKLLTSGITLVNTHTFDTAEPRTYNHWTGPYTSLIMTPLAVPCERGVVRANPMLSIKLAIKDNMFWEGEWKCCVMVFCPHGLLWQTVWRWWRLCSFMKHWGSVVHTNRHLFKRWLKCLYLTWITASISQSAASSHSHDTEV